MLRCIRPPEGWSIPETDDQSRMLRCIRRPEQDAELQMLRCIRPPEGWSIPETDDQSRMLRCRCCAASDHRKAGAYLKPTTRAGCCAADAALHPTTGRLEHT